MFPLLLHNPTLQFERLPRHGGPHTFLQQFEFSNSLHTELLQQIRFGESGGRLSFKLEEELGDPWENEQSTHQLEYLTTVS